MKTENLKVIPWAGTKISLVEAEKIFQQRESKEKNHQEMKKLAQPRFQPLMSLCEPKFERVDMEPVIEELHKRINKKRSK